MSDKIKKYSWVHDLNRAALESQLLSEAKLYRNEVNLKKMLNEEKARKKAFNPNMFGHLSQMSHGGAEIDPKVVQGVISRLSHEGTSPESLEYVDADPSVYLQIGRAHV